MQERRIDTRTVMSHRVKLIHPAFGEITATTEDMSNSGFFVELTGVPFPEVGSMIKVQLLDTPVIAVLKDLQVMRVTATGIGIAFKAL